MRTIILADKLSAPDTYIKLLRQLDIQLLNSYETWTEVIQATKKVPPDFVIAYLSSAGDENDFAYIKQLGELGVSSIIIASELKIENMDAFIKAGVVAYLEKSTFSTALVFQLKKILAKSSPGITRRDFISVKKRGELIRVPFSDIYKIEIDGNYSYLYLATGRRFVLKQSLKSVMEELDETFIRCHRSSIINLKYLASMNLRDSTVVLTNGMELEVGKKFKKALRQAFMNEARIGK